MYIKSGKNLSQIKTYVFIFRAKGSVLFLARETSLSFKILGEKLS